MRQMSIFILLLSIFSGLACHTMHFSEHPSANKISDKTSCSFDKKWFEDNFDAKNIYRIDVDHDGTLFIIMFNMKDGKDSNKLLKALKKPKDDVYINDVYMTQTASFDQIYISRKTLEKICDLKNSMEDKEAK